ncbi:MAG TPA: PHP-associated domain-containing protein, partial [archaeon]|nr:PHP-associated domain-containing protein [archaeon]
GHILALFSTCNPPQSISKIKNSLPVEETIQLIHGAGGIAIAAHVNHELGLRDNVYRVNEIIDGVEEYNAAAGYSSRTNLARKLGVAQIAGSDAHTKITIGLAFTTFPKKECLDERGVVSLNKIIECIKQRKTKGHMIPVTTIEKQFNKARWINPFYSAKSFIEYFNDEQRKIPRKLEACLVE